MPGTNLNGSSTRPFHPMSPYRVYFPQPCDIKKAVCYAQVERIGVLSAQDISVNLYKNITPFITIDLSCNCPSPGPYDFVARSSVDASANFTLTDYLTVKINTGGFDPSDNVYFNLLVSLL